MSEFNRSNNQGDGNRRGAKKGHKAESKFTGTVPSLADLGIEDPEAAAGLVKCEEQLKEGSRKDVESTFLNRLPRGA